MDTTNDTPHYMMVAGYEGTSPSLTFCHGSEKILAFVKPDPDSEKEAMKKIYAIVEHLGAHAAHLAQEGPVLDAVARSLAIMQAAGLTVIVCRHLIYVAAFNQIAGRLHLPLPDPFLETQIGHSE